MESETGHTVSHLYLIVACVSRSYIQAEDLLVAVTAFRHSAYPLIGLWNGSLGEDITGNDPGECGSHVYSLVQGK